MQRAIDARREDELEVLSDQGLDAAELLIDRTASRDICPSEPEVVGKGPASLPIHSVSCRSL